ncbi:PREDICTED: 5-hydroxytryptamine receptor-like [Nicrophorus vespilloides]|uniref:5-hydroxytryptamine receptor-like n=1 Tax=Nicrophorus vespilloides TaxID=110193 RepID=A0ABM1MM97_NICVS|nr:PREDICTED: 5-hydroxytryptamine receptor-like [Nicrophorus vespilloides]
MDYVRIHRLWCPMAAMSSAEVAVGDEVVDEDGSGPASSSPTGDHRMVPTMSRTLAATVTSITSTAVDSSTADEKAWREIIVNADPGSIFRRLENFTRNNNFITDYYESENNCSNLYDTNSTLFDGNFTSNVTTDSGWDMFASVAIGTILGLIIFATIIGNVFVIAAIITERNLQSVANYLILSLAVADLLVACLVMPLGAVYEVSHAWTLGPELCDMWTSSDVLCCTASILHLVAIALDRYWAVTNIDYIHHRTGKRIMIMILVVWCVAFFVCIAPLLGWKDERWGERIEKDKICLVSQDIGYQIFATASSFYLPLLVILILYWRIFQTARKRIRRRQILTKATETVKDNPAIGGIAGGLAAASGTGGIAAAVVTIIGRPLPTISETTTTAFTNVSSNNTSPEKTSCANGLDDPPTTTDGGGGGPGCYQQPQHYPVKRKVKDSADSKRERKAAKTLAIITGAFVMCWLPFFVMAVLLPIYKDLFKEYVISLFLWLGYFNSTLNPIIYTIFSPEFRHAFKKMLCGKHYARRRTRNFGIRHLQ